MNASNSDIITFLGPREAEERWGALTVEQQGAPLRHCIFRELDGFVWDPVFDGPVLLGYRRRVDTIGLLAKGSANSP